MKRALFISSIVHGGGKRRADGMERMDDRPVSGRTHPAPRLGSDRAVYERSSSGSFAKFAAMRGASSLAEFSAQVYSIAQRVPFRANVSNRPRLLQRRHTEQLSARKTSIAVDTAVL